jgi:hypothetical protein
MRLKRYYLWEPTGWLRHLALIPCSWKSNKLEGKEERNGKKKRKERREKKRKEEREKKQLCI